MTTLKIFIASSSELKDDRDEFRLFISQENDRLHTKGLYLELVQWENFLDAISDTRLQDEYNKAISDCDIVICLFFTNRNQMGLSIIRIKDEVISNNFFFLRVEESVNFSVISSVKNSPELFLEWLPIMNELASGAIL